MKDFAADAMQIMMVIGVVAIGWTVLSLQRSRNDFDVVDLFTSPDARGKRRATARDVGTMTALVVSTWGFVYLIVDQRFSEWYFTGYMIAWAGYDVARSIVDNKGKRVEWTQAEREAAQKS